MSAKHKILMVHNYYQLSGGEDTVVANEKKLLESNGHKVVFYTRNNAEIKQFGILKKILLPLTAIFSLKTFCEIRKIIRNEQIDIVHVHNTLMLISPSVYYASLSCKTPIVQTIHNFRLLCPCAVFSRNGHICEACIEMGMMQALKHKCYRNSFLQTLLCISILKVHRLSKIYGKICYICLTEFSRNKFLLLNRKRAIVEQELVFVKPNFANVDFEPIPYEKRKQQYIYVGRLEKIKGIQFLLKAWKNIGEELVVCGTGPLERWCREYVLKNNLANIRLMGSVEHKRVLEIMAESRALIIPSQCYEGFPMTIVESWGCGTPVIGTAIGNINTLIKDGRNGWKIQERSDTQLKFLIQNVTDIVAGCQLDFQQQFTGEKNYQLLIQIYKKILESI